MAKNGALPGALAAIRLLVEVELGDERLGPEHGDGVVEGLLFGFGEKLRVYGARIFLAGLLLLVAEDVGRAFVAGQQVLAVLGVEEFAQRFDATDDEEEVVVGRMRGRRPLTPLT